MACKTLGRKIVRKVSFLSMMKTKKNKKNQKQKEDLNTHDKAPAPPQTCAVSPSQEYSHLVESNILGIGMF